MALQGINTQEVLANAKADVGSFAFIGIAILISLILALIVSKMIDRYLESHLQDALWLQENRNKVRFGILGGGTILFTFMVLSTSSVFSELAWVLAPLAVAIVYMSKKALQNIAEYFVLMLEGKILTQSFIRITNPAVKINTLGKIVERDSRKVSFKTNDGGEIIIRNHDIFEAVVRNYTHSLVRRIDIDMDFPQHMDARMIDTAITSVARKHPKVLSQYPIDPLLLSISEGSLHYSVRFWIARDETNLFRLKQEMKKLILDEVRIEKLELPYVHKDTMYLLS